jgi:misacylated tRNA(Ala) deacylase
VNNQNMRSELLYQTDSYLREFEATVVGVDEEHSAFALNRSVFYPGGGGQPCDRGIFSTSKGVFTIDRVSKDSQGTVWHQVSPSGVIPAIDDQGHGALDWERRYALMRTHTALHVLCGVVFRDYGALVTGGDMEPLHGRMDFEFESLVKEFVKIIENAVNAEINQGHAIHVSILPREQAFKIPDLIRTKINLLPEGIERVRVVEIENLDLQADGGTHVANTREVGKVRVSDYKSKGKNNKRIYLEIE